MTDSTNTTETHARLRASEYVYVPDDDSEFGPVWSTSEALEEFPDDELAEARPADRVISLEGWRGHYLAADWLSCAADLLESCQLDCATYHLDDPANFGLRDRVDAMVHEANESSARYHAHNDVVGADAGVQEDYGTECPEDCPCEWISGVADSMESVLTDLGFVTIWNDGVQTFKVA
jgi:hypothetical protein